MIIKRCSFRIEPDEVEDGRFKVVIYGDDRVIGVPLRGATKKAATDAAPALRIAFEYGWTACDSHARDVLRTSLLRVVQEVPIDGVSPGDVR